METQTLIYLIMGGMMSFTLGIMILVIAGREMYFAFFRRFTTKWNDVFIVNPNKQLSHYYKKSVEGVFKIDGKMYITNPNKLLGLTDKKLKEVTESLSIGRKKLQNRIDKIVEQQGFIKKNIDSLKANEDNSVKIGELTSLHKSLEDTAELLRSKLTDREQNYYFAKRGAYFYIEGDPVPKDFYELYTEMDSVQLENVIMRAQTRDPQGTAELEKSILWIKRFVMFALIAGAVCAFFAIKNNTMIDQLGRHLGITFNL